METRPDAASDFWRRWGWVIALQAILLALLAVDRAPELRGYRPWPPEWQWYYLPGRNLLALLPMAIAGGVVSCAGWMIDCSTAARRWLYVALLAVSMLAFQLSAISARSTELGASLSVRTTVTFLEDFFAAAHEIESPGQAFVDYSRLAASPRQLRVATHPPGAIFLYRSILNFSETHPLFLDFARGFFLSDPKALEYTRGDASGLLLITALKLLAGLLMLPGVWLIVRGLSRDEAPIAGRAMALCTLAPAVVLFSACLDAVVMALSTLVVGLVLNAVRDRRHFLAVLAGIFLFLESMFAYQALAVAFLACLAACLYIYMYRRESAWQHACLFLSFAATAWILWKGLALLSGYDFLGEYSRGVAAHDLGPIHLHRSRVPWIFWNAWDVFFFLGIAWIPLWISRATWRGNPLLIAVMILWVVLHVMDGVRGETARILLFLAPLLSVALMLPNRELLACRWNYAMLCGLLVIQSLVFAAVLNLF